MAKIDFTRAKTLHRSWRTKIKSFIAGKEALTSESAFYHEDCELGKWLYSVGMMKYNRRAQMRKIEKIHARMHTRVREAVEMKNINNEFGSQRAMEKVIELSEQIIDLLNELEKEEEN